MTDIKRVLLIVHDWSSECGACGYGSGGWASSKNPARRGKPILTPRSSVCHGCGEEFTHVSHDYRGGDPRPVAVEADAA